MYNKTIHVKLDVWSLEQNEKRKNVKRTIFVHRDFAYIKRKIYTEKQLKGITLKVGIP